MITLRSSFNTKEFSCSVPNVEFSIQGESALVSIVATKGSASEEIFSETLFPDASGIITIEEMDILLETCAEQWLVFNISVNITESTGSTESLSTQVISCKANIINTTAEDFCNTHFLSLLEGIRQTSQGWLEFLTYIGTADAACIAYYSDGTSANFSVERTTYNDDYSMIDVSPEKFITEGKTLERYVISSGGKSQEYEVIEGMETDIAPILLFFNSFGVQELAYCIGEHQMVSSFDRKQVRIGRVKKSYQIEEKETFKANTGALSYPMANWWREVLRSKNVQVLQMNDGVIDQNSGLPVVINTEKAELSNAADHLPRFTFEYEYADKNHNILDIRREGRIFDNTFDYTFN